MGAQLDGNAAQALEGMAKHEKLCMGVNEAPLPGFRDPGGSDFDPVVVRFSHNSPSRAASARAGTSFRLRGRRMSLSVERVTGSMWSMVEAPLSLLLPPSSEIRPQQSNGA